MSSPIVHERWLYRITICMWSYFLFQICRPLTGFIIHSWMHCMLYHILFVCWTNWEYFKAGTTHVSTKFLKSKRSVNLVKCEAVISERGVSRCWVGGGGRGRGHCRSCVGSGLGEQWWGRDTLGAEGGSGEAGTRWRGAECWNQDRYAWLTTCLCWNGRWLLSLNNSYCNWYN